MQKSNKFKTILSLFDYTGNWSKPYRDDGYNIIQVDIKLGINILDFDYKSIDNVYGVLASVPCNDFATSGARWFAEKDADGRTSYSIRLVDRTMDIIDYHKPKFWVIENPVSRIQSLNPRIGKRQFMFHPWEFAGYLDEPDSDRYRKKTCLWGEFNHPIKRPMSCLENDKILNPQRDDGTYVVGSSAEAKYLRSITPMGFSIAFEKANK